MIKFIKQTAIEVGYTYGDNGLEFTDRFVTKSKQVSGNHQFDKYQCCNLDYLKTLASCVCHRCAQLQWLFV
jgi:hypothetical protein